MPDWQAEIESVDKAANKAFLNRDLQRLDQLFSDDLVVNSPINVVNDKKKLLENAGVSGIGVRYEFDEFVPDPDSLANESTIRGW